MDHLPPGFHHLYPIPLRLEVRSDGNVPCREMRNAISFGKRVALGYDPDEALDELSRA
jgi:hypothetical protein